MGQQARLMSQAMRKLSGKCNNTGTTIIFINQIREKIGVMFGSPETTTGGRALKFYSSVRFDIRRVSGENGAGLIKSGDVLIGHKMRIRAVKNKVGAPARTTVVDLIYGVGIDKEADFIQYATDIGAIEKAGSWYKFQGENLGQGFEKTAERIRGDQELFAKVKVEVLKARAAQKEGI